MRQPMDREQEVAIQVLREAGFVPDGQAWWRQRFAKPGSKRKATVGEIERAFTRCLRPEKCGRLLWCLRPT
jgi:hypothetical protein